MVKQLSHCRTVSSEKRESQAWDTAKKALETTGIYRNNRNLQENRNTVMFFCRTIFSQVNFKTQRQKMRRILFFLTPH